MPEVREDASGQRSRPESIDKVLHRLRTSLNAGEMSKLRSVPVELKDLRELLEWGDPENSPDHNQMYVAHNDQGELVLDFRKPLNWAVFSIEQAENLITLMGRRLAVLKALETDKTLDLYRSMPIDELERLRVAFEADKGPGSSEMTLLFADARIVLVDKVLTEKRRFGGKGKG